MAAVEDTEREGSIGATEPPGGDIQGATEKPPGPLKPKSSLAGLAVNRPGKSLARSAPTGRLDFM